MNHIFMISRLAGSRQSFQKGTNLILVISTEAGQPPIGKPLIVQARGQLRLTWRLYAESPQSGEISLSDGTGGITAGDLSTQSIMGAVPICPIPTRSPARDDGGGEHPSRHFDRSAAEWRNLTPLMTEKPARTLRHFHRSGVEKSPFSYGT